MTIYIFVLTMALQAFPPWQGADAPPDTLLDGTLVRRRALLVSGPNQAAVVLLEENQRLSMPGDGQWKGDLYRVEIDGDRRVTQVRIPKIRVARDILTAFTGQR